MISNEADAWEQQGQGGFDKAQLLEHKVIEAIYLSIVVGENPRDHAAEIACSLGLHEIEVLNVYETIRRPRPARRVSRLLNNLRCRYPNAPDRWWVDAL